MDCFKPRPGAEKIYSISEENFRKTTHKEPPYCRKHTHGESYYAVCPECDNPIQIVGLFKGTVEAGRKAYGRHNKGSIPELAEYCEEDYINCGYSNPMWKKPRGKRSGSSEIAKRLLVVMKEQFDRVIYVLSKDIDIYISCDLAKEMLWQYMVSKGWLYYHATLNNLPWVLGNTNKWHTLFGRKIIRNSSLHKALENHACIRFEEFGKYIKIMNKGKEYLHIGFYFGGHTKTVTDNHLIETIEFCVAEGKRPITKTIFQKTIEIDTKYFLNLINLPKEKSKRDERYLEIAAKMIK